MISYHFYRFLNRFSANRYQYFKGIGKEISEKIENGEDKLFGVDRETLLREKAYYVGRAEIWKGRRNRSWEKMIKHSDKDTRARLAVIKTMRDYSSEEERENFRRAAREETGFHDSFREYEE